MPVGTLGLALCLSGCNPGAGPDESNAGSGGNEQGPGGAGPGDGGSSSGGSGGSANPALDTGGAPTRAARLTHAQYQNTVRDLFGIQEEVASGFAPDAQNGFTFDTNINFVVDSRLAGQFRAAAESIAERVATDPEVFARVVPCEGADSSCRDEFISSFGLRAFRRPLSDAEQARFVALFDEGGSLVESGDDFSDGVWLVVEAMLQSPDFLYRTELQPESEQEDRVGLTSYEIAAKVSYFLYNSTPDDELLRAASEDELLDADEIRRQVERLLESEETLARIVDFHQQAFDFGRYARISLDPETFPDAPPDLSGRALLASRLFVQNVAQNGGGLRELLTAPYAYVDSALSPLYDVEVNGDFERIDFEPDERAGLLTQVGFLASHAYSKKTDPIHRGLFVVRNLLCQTIPDPPAGAAMTPPPEGSPTPKTTREEIEILTGQSSCTGCHSIINPPGFAFESFDAAGALRSEEEGTPVDTRGSLQVDGQWLEFADATDLLGQVAESDEAQSCYLGKWLDFAHGRELPSDETGWVESLPAGVGILELLPEVVSHPSFLTRPKSEVSP